MSKDDKLLYSGVRQVAPKLGGIEICHRVRYEFACEKVHSDDIVIDLGCGCGYGSYMLATSAKNVRVEGYDYSKEAVLFARSHYMYLDGFFDVLDLDTIPENVSFKDASVVVMLEVIEHVKDPIKVLKTISNKISSGASLVISIPQRGKKAGKHPFHLTDFTVDEMRKILEDSEFIIQPPIKYVNTSAVLTENPEKAKSAIFFARRK